MRSYLESAYGKFFRSNTRRAVAALGLVTLSGLCVNAVTRCAQAGTAILPISAKLIRTLEVNITASLDFGTLAITDEDRAGSASIDPGLDRLVVSGLNSLAPAGGTPRAGRLKIRGADKPFTVSIEQSVITLSNGSSTLAVRDVNFITANHGSVINFTPADGEKTFSIPVGATLETKIAQLEGHYVGTTRVFANYQ